jgi:hypothetical protein
MPLALGSCQSAITASAPQNAASISEPTRSAEPADAGAVVDLLNIAPAYTSPVPNVDIKASLYFGYYNENMLARETYLISQPYDRSAASLLIEALLKGPSPARSDLTRLFPAGTRLTALREQEGVLFVTLSEDFLKTPPSFSPADANALSALRAVRRLALSSLINTVTEAAEIDAVQLLVASEQAGANGTRIARDEIFDDINSGGRLLGVMYRDETVMLTHANTLSVVLESWTRQNWNRLYRFVSYESTGGAPALEAFAAIMSECPNAPLYYDISSGSVSEDGTRAVFRADISWLNDGQAWPWSGTIPLMLEDGVWKISIRTLLRLGGYEDDFS